MSDLIERRAAIDKFEPWLKVKEYSEGELNMLKAVLYELKFFPSEQHEPKWIPCSERLPDKNGRYLCTNSRWGAYEVDWNAWINGEWLYPNEKPIAWMPLPEPYKEGEKDDN